MERPVRKHNRLVDYDYSQNGTYFVTVCTQDRKRVLSKIAVGTSFAGLPGEPLVELLPCGKIADKIIRQMNDFYGYLSVDKYMIMPDHIHMLITLQDISGLR